MTHEWNAEAYHRVSDPQVSWGRAVLARLALRGDERVADLGCGTGRLTRELTTRLPRGEVVALDASRQMIRQAVVHLADVSPAVRFVEARLPDIPLAGWAGVVFSTATFHWVRDHNRLFRSLFAALTPGGRLVAQCGGGPNIKRHHDRAAALMQQPQFAPFYTTWTDPWEYADADTTKARLAAAGFADIMTRVVPAPTVFPDRASFVEFVTNVIFRQHIAPLPDEARKRAFVDALADQSAADPVPFEVDYWRLDFDATRPR